MRSDSGDTVSIWMMTDLPAPSPLRENISADVCVIGAGIAGVSTAYLLSRQGKSVIVLDDGPLGGGATSRTTAHLSNAIDDRYAEIERLHGENGARLAAESHTAAIARIEQAVADEQIECDFERLDGFLFVPPNEQTEVLLEELEAAHRAGLTEVSLLKRAPLETFDTGPCLRFPRQAQFHPLKYLDGLIRAITARGGRLFTGTHAQHIKGGLPAHVHTQDNFIITADAVVVTTNTPVNDLFAIHTKQSAYRSYVLGAKIAAAAVPKGLYWDTADPYHYVRIQRLPERESHVLLVGGEDHKTGQANDADERYGRLESWARERFPMMEDVLFRWSGQIMESLDGLAYIGRNPMDEPNVFIATGDSGMGMTHGTIAGILLTDLILGSENPWTCLYDPSRVSLRAAPEFAKETLNFTKQYLRYLTPGDVASSEQIAAETGAVIREGLTKVAVYRDKAGRLHKFSARCPHLGCIVGWNALEKTWDCPCHGSRFTAEGRVVNGPAITDLPPA